MAISWLGRFSQTFLVLTPQCNLKCGFCKLWQTPHSTPSESLQLTALREGKSFFSVFPNRQLFNVVGGDPFCSDQVLFLLKQLKKHRREVRFWTNGLFPAEMFEMVFPYIDELAIYKASTETSLFLEITGIDKAGAHDDLIELAKEHQKPLFLHYPVREETVMFLPEIYDYAFEQSVPLWIHYHTHSHLDGEMLRMVKRFQGVENVYVFKSRPPAPDRCYAVPHFELSWQEGLVYARKQANLLIHLKRVFG